MIAAAKIKKLSIIAAREEIETILRELILLGCVEISDPASLLADREPAPGIIREKMALDHLNASQDNIELLGTQHTLMLSGWIAARSETSIKSKLDNCLCAWVTEDPTSEELQGAPAILYCPNIFGKFRRGCRRQFAPLAIKTRNEA